MKISILFLVCFIGQVLGRLFNNGYYADHPSYRSDNPPRIIARLIPLGLPRGGTSMKGMPYGLLAYAAIHGSWKNMLMQYQKSRMIERSYRMHRAYNSWS